eukprot:CAMPEP_0197194960 /NCGR_PEP_ID=MMETSP1423-20130617/30224_1 /TAXON_ID=476441 /ORGANISM="Pseudo-nitzschia heimii, Strain UNC1101" /LENGTH=50 /DNA_ID=CAMNT_0042648483 /DNA_START=36 /DNA_END=185 /DNA_ORIENTATION=-
MSLIEDWKTIAAGGTKEKAARAKRNAKANGKATAKSQSKTQHSFFQPRVL